MQDTIINVGTRVRYNGDMANGSGLGAIVENGGFSGRGYVLILEDGRKINMERYSFEDSRRYQIIDGQAGQEEIAALIANNAMVEAKERADEIAAKDRFANEVERLKAVYPKLTQGSGPVVAAKNMRKLLKAAFPAVKFSVTTSQYTGGNSITVRWTDGPISAKVEEITELFSGGSFDGMNDSYNYAETPFNSLFGKARYLFPTRDYSDALVQQAINVLVEKWGNKDCPSPEDFRNGNGMRKYPAESYSYSNDWNSLINRQCAEIACDDLAEQRDGL